nr:MAG TPA: hypothetical protein [Caudoviricetes sp.]
MINRIENKHFDGTAIYEVPINGSRPGENIKLMMSKNKKIIVCEYKGVYNVGTFLFDDKPDNIQIKITDTSLVDVMSLATGNTANISIGMKLYDETKSGSRFGIVIPISSQKISKLGNVVRRINGKFYHTINMSMAKAILNYQIKQFTKGR